MRFLSFPQLKKNLNFPAKSIILIWTILATDGWSLMCSWLKISTIKSLWKCLNFIRISQKKNYLKTPFGSPWYLISPIPLEIIIYERVWPGNLVSLQIKIIIALTTNLPFFFWNFIVANKLLSVREYRKETAISTTEALY